LGLVFVAVYQKTLSLLYVDELLAMVKEAFADDYSPSNYSYDSFGSKFHKILRDCEARADAARRNAAAQVCRGTAQTPCMSPCVVASQHNLWVVRALQHHVQACQPEGPAGSLSGDQFVQPGSTATQILQHIVIVMQSIQGMFLASLSVQALPKAAGTAAATAAAAAAAAASRGAGQAGGKTAKSGGQQGSSDDSSDGDDGAPAAAANGAGSAGATSSGEESETGGGGFDLAKLKAMSGKRRTAGATLDASKGKPAVAAAVPKKKKEVSYGGSYGVVGVVLLGQRQLFRGWASTFGVWGIRGLVHDVFTGASFISAVSLVWPLSTIFLQHRNCCTSPCVASCRPVPVPCEACL
jgi:hypothetical protein